MKAPDSNTGERSSGVWGKGFHISTIGDHGVDCPICTCYNDPEYLFKKLGDNVTKLIKCKGCKRKVKCFINPFNGAFSLTASTTKLDDL